MSSDKSLGELALTFLGALALIPLAFLYAAFAYGFVLFKAYHWYMPVAFPHLNYPDLTISGCVAIIMILTTLKNKIPEELELDGQPIKKKSQWAIGVVGPWVSLLCLWLFHFIL